MKKNTKRILTLVMAVLMLMALCTTAFAENDITVYVRVQTAEAPNGYDPLSSLTNIVDCTVYTNETQVTYGGFTYIAISVPAGSTVKDMVNALNHATIVNSCNCGDCGTHTSWGCTCSCTSCTCTWKQVENATWNGSAYVPNGTYSSVLNSLNYNGTTRTNNGGSSYDPIFETWTYTGYAWNYYVDGGYPASQYMSQYGLSGGEHVAISFEYSSFVF